MIEILALTISVIAAVGTAWMYWQVQRTEQRLQEVEARLHEKMELVNELADELVMASRYLYDAMDRCVARIDGLDAGVLSPGAEETPTEEVDRAPADAAPAELPASPQATPEEDVPEDPRQEAPALEPSASGPAVDEHAPALSPVPSEADTSGAPHVHPVPEPPPLSVHARALAYAAQGDDLVEIARRTGLGVEELRLLLRFQGRVEAAT